MRKHPLAAFVVLAYAFSWAVHVPLALSAQDLIAVPLPPSLHFAGAFGPALAALVVTGVTLGRRGLRDLLRRVLRWRVGIGWLLIAAFSPAALFLVSSVIVRLWEGAWPRFSQFGHISEFPNLGWLAGWIVWTLTFGLGEETGWRGFALPRLQSDWDARSATLILGGMWALWHLPQFFYNYDLTLIGVVPFTVTLTSGALILTWLYNNTGGSVLVTTLWHGAYNAVVADAQGITAPLISGFVILAAVLITRATGPDLRRRAPEGLTIGTRASHRKDIQ